MKKIVCIIMIILFVFSVARADSKPIPFDITLSEFCTAYNAIPAPLSSTIETLKKPVIWANLGARYAAVYIPDKTLANNVLIAVAFDENKEESMDKQFSIIQVMFTPDNFPAGIAIAKRCLSIFVEPILTIDISSFAISEIISSYYMNHYENDNLVANWVSVDGYACEFFNGDDGFSYLDIFRIEVGS